MATSNDNIMMGDLNVSGNDEVDIRLKGKPVSILVEFIDDGTGSPCDIHKDDVSYELHFHRKSFVLKIKWRVSGVRKIHWAVDFTG